MKKLLMLFACLIILSDVAYALRYECNIISGRAYCDIPLEDYWKKISDSWDKIRQVYQNVKASVYLGATEYDIDDNATIFAKVVSDGNTVYDAHCDYILFNSTEEIDGGVMSFINGSRGIYSKSFSVPFDTGIYPIDVECIRPVKEKYQKYYFRNNGYLSLKNISGSVDYSFTILDVGVGAYTCYPNLFIEYNDDFADVIFIDNITDNIGYYQKSGTGTALFDIRMNFYSVGVSKVFIGSTYNTVSISATSPTIVNLPNIIIDRPVLYENHLEVEICAMKIVTPMNDLTFWFNSSTYNSSFKLGSKSKNETLDFNVGGSSELNIRSDILNILKNARILNERITKLDNDNYCISNTTLRHNITYRYCEDSKCKTLSDVMDEECDYGCDYERDVCNPPNYMRYAIIFAIVITVIMIVLFALWLMRRL